MLQKTGRGLDPDAFEIAVCRAFEALGYAARHIGGHAAPDGYIDAPLGQLGYRSMLECKTSYDSDVRTPFAAEAAKYKDAYDAQYCSLIVPSFGGDVLFSQELKKHEISAWEVPDLVALLEAGSNPWEIGRARLTCRARATMCAPLSLICATRSSALRCMRGTEEALSSARRVQHRGFGADLRSALTSKLDALRPLNQDRIQLLWPHWRAEDALFVYATNAVEGRTLTLGETLVLLEHGVTVGGKPMSDYLDAVNGQKAYSAMLGLAQKRANIGLETVLDLHRTIVGNVSYGGQLRDERRLVDEMLTRYDEGVSNCEHPIRVASTLHFDLLTIHPFKDGNGRTARLLENLHLIREGFVPILIGPEEKPRYFDVLQRSQVAVPGVGDPTEFIAYMADLEKGALERYLAALHTAHGESSD